MRSKLATTTTATSETARAERRGLQRQQRRRRGPADGLRRPQPAARSVVLAAPAPGAARSRVAHHGPHAPPCRRELHRLHARRARHQRHQWSPRQEEVLGVVACAVSLDDEEAKRQHRRRLFISGGPGSGKSAVLLEIAVRCAKGALRVLIVCPTGQLVHSFKSQPPRRGRY